jgi:hypothetical protein
MLIVSALTGHYKKVSNNDGSIYYIMLRYVKQILTFYKKIDMRMRQKAATKPGIGSGKYKLEKY